MSVIGPPLRDIAQVVVGSVLLLLVAYRLTRDERGIPRLACAVLWFIALAVALQMLEFSVGIRQPIWKLVLLAAGVAFQRRSSTSRTATRSGNLSGDLDWRAFSPPTLAVVSFAVCAVLYIAVASIGKEPWDFDSRMYHVPEIARWIHGAPLLQAPGSEAHSPYPYPFFPKNGELLMSWFAPSMDLMGLTPLAGFFNLALAVSGLFLLARLLGCSSDLAVFGTALFAGSIVLHGGPAQQLGTQGVDLFGASVAPLEVWLLLRLFRSETPRARDLTPIGICAGLAIGSKWYHLIYQAPMLMAAMILVVRQRRRVTALLHLAVPILVLGMVWYGNSWVRFENPFHPAELKLFGRVVFAGDPDITNCSAAVIRRNPFCSIAGEVVSLAGEGRWRELAEFSYTAIEARTILSDGIIVMAMCVVAVGISAARLWTPRVALGAVLAGVALVLGASLPASDGRWIMTNQRFSLVSIMIDHAALALLLNRLLESRMAGSTVQWVLVAWTMLVYATSGIVGIYPTRIAVVAAAFGLFVALGVVRARLVR